MPDSREGGVRQFVPIIAAAAPTILVRLGGTYLRFLSERRRGVKAFSDALRESDVPPELAGRLTQAYHDAGSLRRFVGFGRK